MVSGLFLPKLKYNFCCDIFLFLLFVMYFRPLISENFKAYGRQSELHLQRHQFHGKEL